jgi:rhodanese-related sulfurtransferase
MRHLQFVIFTITIISLSLLTGCNSTEGKTTGSGKASSTATQQEPPHDGVRRISISEARAEIESGKAVMIDVREEPSYNSGHIKGALLIPLNEVAARSNELPTDKTIILYCSCPEEHSSVLAAQALKTKTISNTAALVGGYPAWKGAGYEIEEPAQ